MIDWGSNSSSFSRAFPSTPSTASSCGREVENCIEGGRGGVGANDGGSAQRRVVFVEPSVANTVNDMEEIDEQISCGDATQRMASSSKERVAVSTPPQVTRQPADPLMEPATGRTPPQRHSAGTRRAAPGSGASQGGAAPTEPLTRENLQTHVELTTAVTREGPKIRLSEPRSAHLWERRPVNEREASKARVTTNQRAAAMLAVYRTIKRNTQTRIFRVYYDKWRLRVARPPALFTTDAATPSREMRGTQTSPISAAADVESYDGALSMEAALYADGAESGCDTLSCCSSIRSASPIVQPPPAAPRPAFQYSKAPALKDGIAARTRPAAHIKDVSKSDQPPRRKGASPPRMTPGTQLPAVVPNPLRVHRR